MLCVHCSGCSVRTGFCWTHQLNNANQHNTSKALEQTIHRCGPPHRIQSDQVMHFIGHNVRDRAHGLGTDWIVHVAYFPKLTARLEE